MKKVLALLIVSLSVTICKAQWISFSTFYNYYYLSSACIGEDTIFVAGFDNATNEGKIVKTFNQGQSWSEPILPSSTPQLFSIVFPDAVTGFAAGQAGTIIKTADGGNTWTQLTSGTTQQITALWFTDKDTGYACGAGGILLKTINGGIGWTPLNAGTSMILHSVCFPEPSTGYLVAYGNPLANGAILKSVDYGNTWTPQSSPLFGSITIRGQKVLFINADTGMIAGLSGDILYTFDGGQNWIMSGAGLTNKNLNNIAYAGEGIYYMCGGAGKVLKSIDYGVTVTDGGSANTTSDFYAISICDSAGYIFGTSGGALKSDSLFPGIKENKSGKNISVFPVPGEGLITINSEEEMHTVRIITVDGKIRKEIKLNKTVFKLELDCKELSRGIYFLQVESTDNSIRTGKIIID